MFKIFAICITILTVQRAQLSDQPSLFNHNITKLAYLAIRGVYNYDILFPYKDLKPFYYKQAFNCLNVMRPEPSNIIWYVKIQITYQNPKKVIIHKGMWSISDCSEVKIAYHDNFCITIYQR